LIKICTSRIFIDYTNIDFSDDRQDYKFFLVISDLISFIPGVCGNGSNFQILKVS